MGQEWFPTFKNVGHQALCIMRHPLARKIGLFVGGAVLPTVWHRYVSRTIPTRYLSEAWHLYLVAPGGFAGAFIGAWGLKHRWWSFIFGIGLGLVYGGEMFFFHGVSLFVGGPEGMHGMIAGDYTAGLVFFLFSTAGGLLGAYRAGVGIPFGSESSPTRNVRDLVLIALLVAGFWVGLYYVRQWLVSLHIL